MTATSDQPLTEALRAIAPQVVSWRRYLHQHPELSHAEQLTADYIARELTALGLEPRRLTPTSVVADLAGGHPGRTVAVRADIDALPIVEATGLPFASANPGVMHACGHDGHTAVLLGVAAVLVERRAELRGSVRFVFQHAEEQMPKGAPELIAAGVLDGVDVIIGQHLWADLPVGEIGINHGALLAAPDLFEVRFTGRGGHGAMPYDAIEVIPAAAEFVQATQRLVSREFSAVTEPVVVSVSQIHAGDAFNVLPGTATLGGTARTLAPATRERVEQRLRELAHAIAATHRIEAEFDFQHGPPPLINTPAVVDAIAAQAAPDAVAVPVPAAMPGDDYADYLLHVPGAYVFVGATEPGTDPVFPHHHPRFDISERALPIATALLARSALALGDPARSAIG